MEITDDIGLIPTQGSVIPLAFLNIGFVVNMKIRKFRTTCDSYTQDEETLAWLITLEDEKNGDLFKVAYSPNGSGGWNLNLGVHKDVLKNGAKVGAKFSKH